VIFARIIISVFSKRSIIINNVFLSVGLIKKMQQKSTTLCGAESSNEPPITRCI